MTAAESAVSSRPAPPDPCTVVPPGGGPSYWVVGDLITLKLGPDQTGCPCTDPSAPPPPIDQSAIDKLMAACPQYGVRMLFDHQPAGGPAPLPDRGTRLWVRGVGDQQVHVRLTEAETGGAFTVCEVTS